MLKVAEMIARHTELTLFQCILCRVVVEVVVRHTKLTVSVSVFTVLGCE